MATIERRPLKGYVRYDGRGRIIGGSLILRKKMPKVGKWVEIQPYECCTTPNIRCVEYLLTLARDEYGTYTYTDCNGLSVGPVGLTGVASIAICAERDTMSTTGDIVVTNLGLCSESTSTSTTTQGPSVSSSPSSSISSSASSSVSPSTSISSSASESISSSVSTSISSSESSSASSSVSPSSSISSSASSSISSSESSSVSSSISSSESSSVSPSPSGG